MMDGWQIEKAELTAQVEGLTAERDHYRLALTECKRQARLDKDDLDRFIKIITDLGLEFAPSEKVQWRNRKAIDLEQKLAECEREKEQFKKLAVEMALPYEALLMDAPLRKWLSPEVWSAIETAVIKMRAALTEAGDAGFCNDCGGPIYHRPNKPGEFDHECKTEAGEGGRSDGDTG